MSFASLATQPWQMGRRRPFSIFGRSVVPEGEIVGLRVRRFLIAALEQQMWFFGCDSACADGNLLVRYGFSRFRTGQHRGVSSRYRLLWRPSAVSEAPASQIDLHGWCAGLHRLDASCEAGFLYVRGGTRIGWYEASEPPDPGQYDDHFAPGVFHLLGRRPEPGFCRAAALFFRWVEEYERWIDLTCGPGYRQRCFACAPQPWLAPRDGRSWLTRYRETCLAAVNHKDNQQSDS